MNPVNDKNETINNYEQFFMSITGEEIWSKLHEETKIDLLTAQVCFDFLKENGYRLDYSSVIAPLMKCLEHELTQFYYVDYLKYLKLKYSAKEFIDAIDKNCDGDVVEERKKLLDRDDSFTVAFLETPNEEFTIGDFRFTIGLNQL